MSIDLQPTPQLQTRASFRSFHYPKPIAIISQDSVKLCRRVALSVVTALPTNAKQHPRHFSLIALISIGAACYHFVIISVFGGIVGLILWAWCDSITTLLVSFGIFLRSSLLGAAERSSASCMIPWGLGHCGRWTRG